MKKLHIWILIAVILALAAAGAIIFREEIGDLLFPVKNGWDEKDGQYYYNNWEGERLTGWLPYEGANYYLDPSAGGAMHTGWLTLNGSTYYLNEGGRGVTGWLELDGEKRYFLEDSRLASGWLDMEEGRRWFEENGVTHIGWLDTDAGRYWFDGAGIMHTGWLNTEEGYYWFDETGRMHTGWLDTDEGRRWFGENGLMHTGWLDADEGRRWFDATGLMHTGWLELDGFSYYLDESGCMYTGWLETESGPRYFREDGTLARGRVTIDEKVWHFTSTGAPVLLVNRWNPVPEDYTVELTVYNGKKISVECVEALDAMLQDCPYYYNVSDIYRTYATQAAIWDRYIANYRAQGASYDAALYMTASYVALPGTSEHQLGLAVDIRGGDDVHGWLEENCWDYGFILRYPDNKKDITGIAYEDWHYRYVGMELAQEMKGTGLCLEEYLDALTTDGSTCSNPENLTAGNSETAE